jgi:hypothetical protein
MGSLQVSRLSVFHINVLPRTSNDCAHRIDCFFLRLFCVLGQNICPYWNAAFPYCCSPTSGLSCHPCSAYSSVSPACFSALFQCGVLSQLSWYSLFLFLWGFSKSVLTTLSLLWILQFPVWSTLRNIHFRLKWY